jgi:hypothetical protein
MNSFVTTILPAHILAGGLAIVFGYVALWATKGGGLHRKSGQLFVGTMLTMALSGAAIAVFSPKSQLVSVVAGLLTFYLVASSLVTGSLLAGTGRPEAIPAFIFALVSLLAAVGDWRVLRAGGVQGPRRIRRHFWRMCFAMWVAAASFFWGPPGRVPDAINVPAFLAVAVLTPIAAMAYWFWQTRRKAVRTRPVVARTADAGVFIVSPVIGERH